MSIETMTDKGEPKAIAPRATLKAADATMQRVRRATRPRFSAEDKIRVVIAGLKGEQPISDLCRHEGVHTVTFYTWQKDFMEAGKARLRGDTTRDANKSEVESLRRENQRLKMLVGEQLLENQLLKKSVVF